MTETTPELRIGKKERDATLNILTEAYVDERIQTREEYDERVEKALEATTQTQLDILTADLVPTLAKTCTQHTPLKNNNDSESYDSSDTDDEGEPYWEKDMIVFFSSTMTFFWIMVGLFWFFTVFKVEPSTETQTATVTSSTPTSCNENTCNYPMILTTDAGEKVEVEGKFHKSSYGTPIPIPIGEEETFQKINGEWKNDKPSQGEGIAFSTAATTAVTLFSLSSIFMWRHPEKF